MNQLNSNLMKKNKEVYNPTSSDINEVNMEWDIENISKTRLGHKDPTFYLVGKFRYSIKGIELNLMENILFRLVVWNAKRKIMKAYRNAFVGVKE